MRNCIILVIFIKCNQWHNIVASTSPFSINHNSLYHTKTYLSDANTSFSSWKYDNPRVIKTESITSCNKQLQVKYKILLIQNVINLVIDVTYRYYNASDISKLMGHYSIFSLPVWYIYKVLKFHIATVVCLSCEKYNNNVNWIHQLSYIRDAVRITEFIFVLSSAFTQQFHRLRHVVCIISYGYDRQHNNLVM